MVRPLARTPPLPWRRLARRARRSLALRWLLVAAAALGAAAQTARIGAAAEAARDGWGASVEVVVAAADLAPGHVVGRDDVRSERWPRAVVPDGAVDEAPLGRTVTAPVVSGEALVEARLAPAGLSATAALVPAGWRAVAVPASSTGLGVPAPPLAVGDRVDLLAPDPVARSAVVVHVGDGAVTVAVPEDDAVALAEALAASVVAVVLVGP